MRGITKLLIVVSLLAAVVVPAAQAKTAAELLREGLYVEEVEGDLDKAVEIYQQIVLDSSAPKHLAAQALYRQGSIYLKKKQDQNAKEVFTRLVTDYSDQTEIVEKVKPLLEELGNSDPASLMPPETIAYIEIGSPGQQVDTILKMLKDTPVEEALASLNKDSGWDGGGPAAMIRGLLNPSMMAEFKKIRGVGIGLMDVTQNNPPAVVVLYPGKSDALMGVLRMVMTSLGQAGESVEGMSVVTFGHNDATAAFDDTVVIASTSPDLLQQAIRRHKGKLPPTSLASANRSFTSISKQARQQNALTLWLNVDETYGRLMKTLGPDDIPEHIQIANGFVDFQNVDDLIASLSLRETGVAVEANMNFKDGSKSMFYNLIRTPNLNREMLKAIPAEAVALISLTLGAADSAQAQALGAQIKEKTGLDLGPQIFGNVEQITLFATPPKDAAASPDSPIPAAVQALGLAVTSKNPEQVQQLVTTLLQAANLLPQEAAAIPSAGRFDLTLANGMKVFGHTEQANKTMVISLTPRVVESAVAAMKQNASVVDSGRLHDALMTLPPATSKLVLVNAAGAIRIVAQNLPFPSEEVAAEVRPALDELANAAEKTTVRLQTSEQDNSFSVRLSVNDLPPLGKIVDPIARIAEIMEQAEASARGDSDQPAEATVCVRQASRPPEIDGKADGVWVDAESNAIANVAYSPASDERDFSASFKTMYDSEALYLLVDVADDKLVNDSDEFWLDDAVEVFLDADNSKSESYEDGDYGYNFSWDASAPTLGETKHDQTEGVKYAFAKTDDGYRVEIKLPWSTLGTTPRPGGQIGLDVHVNDDDDGGDRDTKLMWCTTDDNAWQNPSALGTGNLAGLVAWWALDEKEGSEAADSSGNGHNGTIEGNPTWQPAGGKIGGALQLDGDGDYVDTDYDSDLATWTAAVWVNSPAAPDSSNQSGPVHREKNLQINWNHVDDTFRGAAGVCIGGTWYGASFGDLQPNTWYHLTATFDGKSLRAYKNGALIMANGGASGVPNAEAETLKLGRHARDDSCFAGTIDEVRIYNYSLSEPQIKELSQGR